ncbi:CinA family nicotinamide mononucleotide deamidase-related protein [Chitinophaga sancti]|uniref:CinA-like protein n=1 Tax=Chitinophaga sancti TaxID=1004 RepID=A0A1K1QUA5_9BACT|nr:CinA family nicotinamide mononucleotide deamidase-related protein [Chitinophaga sancti]WQD61929.1 CinA family nicotinamide mononucleotide deamidase-related protein [Chitinophaga sancti]WQG92502.1 CinA family nicotinamide mononucleotide deamidase-related protein [Chitinophaga sancti]SFW63265.1 nicotinamide-nucleotide amidase [Chitinophaga sancti]
MEGQKVVASIITIGDELLIGQTIDTNSAWMAQQLNAMGIWVHRRVAIGDVKEAIVKALDDESALSPIVLITGGLGPTADDITKPTLAEYFGGTLVRDEATFKQVMEFFESRGLPPLQRNMDQALVPDVCTVLHNKRGTAPGMWFEKDGKVFVSMPGVPFEMKGLMEDHVLPRLKQYFQTPVVVHQTLIIAGMGESFVAERLVDFEAQLPANIKLAYLPSLGTIKLRLTAHGQDKLSTAASLSMQFHKLKDILSDIVIADQDQPIAAVIGQLLQAKGKTVGTAESCTGGYIAHSMTSVPGSSAWYRGSVISYANEIKTRILGVKPETLAAHGAVSEAVVKEMVRGALAHLQTDYVIAVSGIMGPDGGTPEKPVGTVWIGVGSATETVAVKFQLRYDRYLNIQMAAAYAMSELRKIIL